MNPDEPPTTSKSKAELVFTLVWFILLFAGIPFTLPKFMRVYSEADNKDRQAKGVLWEL